MKENFENKDTIKAIGIMSGTSVDGLDVAAVEFSFHQNKWSFQLITAETLPYSKKWENSLKTAQNFNGEQLTQLHSDFGKLIGEQALNFIQNKNFVPDMIASHGHTIFHQPEKGYTLQIGNGTTIATATGITTISDFRTGDVALGGQGAPLVPIGDKLLFSDYEYCLNLGGFANISFDRNGKRLAFDNCPVNFVLNRFAEKKGLPFDKDGKLGRLGEINTNLLKQLNELPYYKAAAPKSLGREWVEKDFLPILENSDISFSDKLRTVYEHIAIQIGRAITNKGKILITGGGAFNSFLIERIKAHISVEVIIPPKEIIDFKEAIIFAFLGVLRVKGINNCMASVTGASRDSCGGRIFMP